MVSLQRVDQGLTLLVTFINLGHGYQVPYQKSDGEGFSGILYANRGWDGELVTIRAEFLPYQKAFVMGL